RATPSRSALRNLIYVNPKGDDIQQNFARIGSESIDRLFAQAAAELNPDKAIDLANRIDALIWAEVHSLALYQQPEIIATKPHRPTSEPSASPRQPRKASATPNPRTRQLAASQPPKNQPNGARIQRDLITRRITRRTYRTGRAAADRQSRPKVCTNYILTSAISVLAGGRQAE